MAELIEYKCPNCGGVISFDPEKQMMRCPFCDSEFDTAAVMDAMNEDLSGDGINWEKKEREKIGSEPGMVSYICNSCGGEIICESSTAASSCPFCGNPVVMSENVSGMLKPDLVLPFKLSKKEAKSALERHYAGKPLLPKFFRDENRIEEIKGVYVPFWLYGGRADAEMRFHATRDRFWADRKFNYHETSHFRLIRSGSLSFSNVPVDGSSKMPNDIMEAIEPFDISSAVDFGTAYLSGFFADKYDVPAEECEERADERIRNSAIAVFSSTAVGYSSVVPEVSSVSIRSGEAKYALLPVWLLTTAYNGKKYTFAMNGQSGKFVGDLPVSRGRYFGALGLISLLSALCVFLLSYLLF